MPCYTIKLKDGTRAFLHGDLGPHCRHCGDVGALLCDYPVGDGKTCDAPLCDAHGREIAPDTHYCPAHLKEWQRFRATGGVHRVLSKVVPYKRDGAPSAQENSNG